jgi:hypothetical protein
LIANDTKKERGPGNPGIPVNVFVIRTEDALLVSGKNHVTVSSPCTMKAKIQEKRQFPAFCQEKKL